MHWFKFEVNDQSNLVVNSSDTQLGLIILFHTIPKYSHL
jgi:hypothetical protein